MATFFPSLARHSLRVTARRSSFLTAKPLLATQPRAATLKLFRSLGTFAKQQNFSRNWKQIGVGQQKRGIATAATSGGGGGRVALLASAIFSGITGAVIGVYGQPLPEEEVHPERDYSQEPEILQYIYRARDNLSDAWEAHGNPEFETDLLPELPPYIYKVSPYVLVLDLEDTLVHTEWTPEHGYRTIKRPGLDYFLEYVSSRLFGEVIVFSDLQVTESSGVSIKIDPKGFIMHRLYKGHQRYKGGDYYKDLTVLGRDLSKVIIVDDKPEKYSLQKHNGIKIKHFNGDPNDTTLLELIPFLEAIVQAGVPDVTEVIKKYENVEDIPAAFIALKQRQKEEMARQREEAAAAAAATTQVRSKRFGGWF